MPAEIPEFALKTGPTSGAGPALPRTRAGTRSFAILLGMLALLPFAYAQVSKEYDLKAVLLFNFARYAEWPASAFAKPDSPLVIGVLGKDPFGQALDDVVRKETYNERPIVIARFQNASTARESHILFVSESERDKLPSILAELKDRPVLTVSDMDYFAPKGGVIGFHKNAENKLRPQVNLAAAKNAGLKLRSKLLRVSEVIGHEER